MAALRGACGPGPWDGGRAWGVIRARSVTTCAGWKRGGLTLGRRPGAWPPHLDLTSAGRHVPSEGVYKV